MNLLPLVEHTVLEEYETLFYEIRINLAFKLENIVYKNFKVIGGKRRMFMFMHTSANSHVFNLKYYGRIKLQEMTTQITCHRNTHFCLLS